MRSSEREVKRQRKNSLELTTAAPAAKQELITAPTGGTEGKMKMKFPQADKIYLAVINAGDG